MKNILINAIADMKEDEAMDLVHAMLDAGEDPQVILEAASQAMVIVGDRFNEQEYFLPELIIAGDMMKAISNLVMPRLRGQAIETKTLGMVFIGTVAGDIHDIGKDVVSFMLEVNSFKVYDLGVDVPAATFVNKIQEFKPDIVGLSGLLTMAFDEMKRTVEAIKQAGLRDNVKIMVGGAIMDESAAQYIGADAYGADALAAVKLAKGWMA